ncbi:MAG: potassium channel protein [Candidatus Dadabacteria bacterium]|nr:MAG: potassium channel protein [Candidatus Dadabacteria bacterium]
MLKNTSNFRRRLSRGDFRRPSRDMGELFLLLFAIILVVLLGASGYTLIEDWSFFDSLYMTIITLSTVGYGEVHPLSPAGRIFSICLIIVGVGVAMVVLTSLSQIIIERQMRWVFEGRRMQQTINELNGHTIFCGYGRLSRIAAERLRESDIDLVIIDSDETRIEEARAEGFLVVQGDATLDETLREAGIERAARLVSLLPKDSDNLYVILSSREMNRDLYILSRAEDEIGEKRLRTAGANRIMSPYRVGGIKIADGLLRPYVTDFLDITGHRQERDIMLEEIKIPNDSPLAGKTLVEAALRQQTNIIVAAIITEKGEMIFNPSGNTKMEAGATLIGLGLKSDFKKLEELLIAEQ